jgi:PKD repeat protein
MKKNYFICLIILISVSITSCKKDDPKPISQSQAQAPVFSFSGEINGMPLSLQAGMNDYFVSTSYALNQNGVYEFNSSFKNKNCASNCPNSLSISINDYHTSATEHFVIDSAITAGNYQFAAPSGIPAQFVQSFIGGLWNKAGASYSWNFGDNTPVVKTTLPTITHKYEHSGIYNVALTVLDNTGLCTSTIINTIKFGQLENTLLGYYSPANIIGDSVLFTTAAAGGVAPYTYLWDFGDGSVSASSAPIHKYASSGAYSTSLTIKDANGDTDVQHAYVVVQSSSACASYFRPTTLTTVKDSLNLSGITIEWTDPSGVVWTSYNDKQTSENSFFKIISVEDYLPNENGNPTKKMQVAFACKLYNGSAVIELKNATATIAVAYKK